MNFVLFEPVKKKHLDTKQWLYKYYFPFGSCSRMDPKDLHWKHSLLEQLRQRDKKEKDPFESLIASRMYSISRNLI